jgi:hypothetical protein
VLKSFADNLQGEINIETDVSKTINAISSEQIEKMFLPALQYFSFCWYFFRVNDRIDQRGVIFCDKVIAFAGIKSHLPFIKLSWRGQQVN